MVSSLNFSLKNMRHLKRGKKLSRTSDERKALLRGLANSLILHDKIKTTEARAKALRPFVEKLITKGRKPNLANRRYVLRFLNQKATAKVFSSLSKKYKARPGGYTRIVKLGKRGRGDNASLAHIELV